MEHIWTIHMHKILQTNLLCSFVANLKIDAIYVLYPESFWDKNLAIRKVFAFSDSDFMVVWLKTQNQIAQIKGVIHGLPKMNNSQRLSFL